MSNIAVDFQIIDNGSPKVLTILDTSLWFQIQDKESIIEIITPGEKNPVIHYFNKGEVNIFNSNNLGLTCSNCDNNDLIDLPDGIYKITLKGSPDKYYKTKNYLKLNNVELDLSKLYINFLNNGSSGYNDSISDIEFLLSAARAEVKFNNINAASKLLFKAKKIISKINCKGCNE